MNTLLLRIWIAASCVTVGACDTLPWLEAQVALPDGSTAQVMIRAGGEYRVTFSGANGIASHSLSMPIDDGHRRANLYWTPENWLVVIDAGGEDSVFDLTPGRAPTDITLTHTRLTARQSRRWRYLGVVKRAGSRSLIFRLPSEEAECIPLYGAGSVTYRPQAQDEDQCANPSKS